MSAEEAAAAAVLSHSQGEAAREEKAGQERLANSGFGKLLGRAIFEKTVSENDVGEARIREALHSALLTSFTPIVGISLATQPRQLRSTFDVALALGIDIVREPQYLWLADLAQSLPVPFGWSPAEHPTPGQPMFWHNELCGSSQWQHPVDEYIKQLLQALRTPLNPRSGPIVRVLLGEGAMKEAGLS